MAGQDIGDAAGSRVLIYQGIAPFGQLNSTGLPPGNSRIIGITQTDASATNPSQVTVMLPVNASVAAITATAWGSTPTAGSITFTVTGSGVGAASLVVNGNGSLISWSTGVISPGTYAIPVSTPFHITATVTNGGSGTSLAQTSGGICIAMWAYMNFV